MIRRVQLDNGWEFKQTTSLGDGAAQDFLPVAQFPTVSFLDLMHHKLIPDPYLDANETKTTWVNVADWTYRTTKIEPVGLQDGERAVLVFEGLDTAVEVYLAEHHILSSKNMHRAHRVDITELVRSGQLAEPYTLELRFTSAITKSRQERERIGFKNDKVFKFGNEERLFLRKAQYHWGWDWGPTVQPSGPWKPIYLEVFKTRIVREKVLVTQTLAEDLASATVSVAGSADYPEQDIKLKVELLEPASQVVADQTVSVTAEGRFRAEFTLKSPKLWYPHQYGEQPLYLVRLTLDGDNGSLDRFEQKIGLRRIRLLQHPLKNAAGTSFTFEVNNIRVFCGGSCWIPGDFLLPRMTPDRYRDWLSTIKRGNQTMVRVWGGGIMEHDCFYDICDAEGILVWQDFLFACGNYPASPDVVDEVVAECEGHVFRVGHHPSIAVWAGNNEDYQHANEGGWDWDPKNDGPWDETNFPARLLYEKVLPEIIGRLGRHVPYVRSSPYGGAENANDPTIGDNHIWSIWHDDMAPYQNYKEFMGRFVSEFGFESAPSTRTIHSGLTDPRERFSQSRTWLTHDKSPGHHRRLAMYMSENFRFVMSPLDAYVYCTQFLQAEAMSYAYNLWRREFRGPGEENCSGALVWQLNDIWPCMSWAVIDYHLRPKAGWFVMRRALQTLAVGCERVVTREFAEGLVHIEPEKRACELWAVNGTVVEVKVSLRLAAWDIETGEAVKLSAVDRAARAVTLAANRSTDLLRVEIPRAETTVLAAYLEDDEGGRLLARWVSWPEPFKYLRFRPDVKVEVEVLEGGEAVRLTTNAPVKGVTLEVPMEEGEDAAWEDNFVDLVPGEKVVIHVKGLDGRTVKPRWLCSWEQPSGPTA